MLFQHGVYLNAVWFLFVLVLQPLPHLQNTGTRVHFRYQLLLGKVVLVSFFYSLFLCFIESLLCVCVADASLAQKLQAEIKYEKDMAAEAAGDPEWLTAFKKEKIWTVRCDNITPGDNLTRYI